MNYTHVIQKTVFGTIIVFLCSVEVSYYAAVSTDEFDFRFSVIHYYAKGVGEIYNFYPDPTTGFGNVSSYIQ